MTAATAVATESHSHKGGNPLAPPMIAQNPTSKHCSHHMTGVARVTLEGCCNNHGNRGHNRVMLAQGW